MVHGLIWRLRCRPIIGMFIRDRVLPLPSRSYWVVEHPRTGLYWRDPYHVRGDPSARNDWGRFNRAWRFPTRDLALTTMATEHVAGTLREIPLP